MTKRAGDAFDTILGPLVRRGYLLAVTMLEDREDAEDAVQEASIKAWRNLGDLRDTGKLEPWFLAIVANECRSIRRRRRSEDQLEAVQDSDRFDEDRAVAALDLDRALARLHSEDRAALYLHYYEDLTFEQAAQVTGEHMTAVRSRIYRALDRLRPGLTQQEDEHANG